MSRRWILVLLMVGLPVAGCDRSVDPEPSAGGGSGSGSPGATAVDNDHEASVLPRPFTAEQIRGEWAPGLTLTMRTRTPDGETFERWTVLDADADGAGIEFATLDAEGNVVGEPRMTRAGWIELRDHATYASDVAHRLEVTRDTPLGTMDGWLYTVRDEAEGLVTEFFFAQSLPGAPVFMRVSRGEELVMELAQIERARPDAPSDRGAR